MGKIRTTILILIVFVLPVFSQQNFGEINSRYLETIMPHSKSNMKSCSISFDYDLQKQLEGFRTLYLKEKCKKDTCFIYPYKDMVVNIFCQKKNDYCSAQIPSYFGANDTSTNVGCLENSDGQLMKKMIPFSVNINQNQIYVSCDFLEVKKNDEENFFSLLSIHSGVCPVWIKQGEWNTLFLIELKDNLNEGWDNTIEPAGKIIQDRFVLYVPVKLLIKECSDSRCSFFTASYSKTHNVVLTNNLIAPLCDFITVDENFHAKEPEGRFLSLNSEGICPIKIFNDNGTVDTVYIKSVKTKDGYVGFETIDR